MAEQGAREKQGGDRAKSQGATLETLGIDKHESSRFVTATDYTVRIGMTRRR